MTTTLQIEHPISDFVTWRTAFGQFAEARAGAGARAERIAQPVDDAHYVVVELDFDSVQAATNFENFLRTIVWALPENSPALEGTPTTRILRVIDPSAAGAS